MKKIISIVAVVLLIGCLCLYYITMPDVITYKSPDGEYTLTVSGKRNIFDISMPGNGGSGSKEVIIKVFKHNDEIASSESNSDFDVVMGDIRIEWDTAHNEVFYAIARSIDLKTGEFLY
ncbi:hypothetical protein [Aquimarina longa]|uniref:hypothetical protein n=1 Tax=Aquimarina longa TaxID=1080221 RepID=UPI000780A14F|nr:hypothetical protein [Aquimarina longa]